jgi:drug/metabolite transporter (DMT)-like permease
MFGAAVMFASERSVIRSPLFIAGISMLLSGTLLTLVFKEGGLGNARSTTGVAIAISSGVLYAGYSLSVRKFMHGIPAFTAFSAVSQYTGVALVLLMLALGDRSGLLLSEAKELQAAGQPVPRDWLVGGASVFALGGRDLFFLLLSAILGIGMGHTFYYYSIQRLGLAVATGVVQLQPVTVSICSVVIFDERLKAIQWTTGLIAICGAVCMLAAQQILARRALASK